MNQPAMSPAKHASSWCTPVHLQGVHARLEPLDKTHAEGLRRALHGDALSKCWYTNVPNSAHVDAYIEAALLLQTQDQVLPFVVRDAADDIVGCTRYYDLDVGVRRLSIGYTWYVPGAQRTGVNTETKLLLLRHAFEQLGCVAVAFETSWFNQASRAAIARLGAKQEGVLRNHRRHADGSLRDTVVFSIIDNEWPAVAQNLRFRLAQHESIP